MSYIPKLLQDVFGGEEASDILQTSDENLRRLLTSLTEDKLRKLKQVCLDWAQEPTIAVNIKHRMRIFNLVNTIWEEAMLTTLYDLQALVQELNLRLPRKNPPNINTSQSAPPVSPNLSIISVEKPTTEEKELRKAASQYITTYNEESNVNILEDFITAMDNYFKLTTFTDEQKITFLQTKLGPKNTDVLYEWLQVLQIHSISLTWDNWKSWMRSREVFRNDECKAENELHLAK
ncbi:hypothetical protein HK096_010716, partial [Nowakowskiella sp. JEL0078]